jgi:hypothetical protein
LAAILKERFNTEDASAVHQIFVRDGDRCWIMRLADISLLEPTNNEKASFNTGSADTV